MIRTRLIALLAALSMLLAANATNGQSYRMCKIAGVIGTGDRVTGYSDAVAFSWNPTQWRYGRWGGSGWTNGSNLNASAWNGTVTASAVDQMDVYFRMHDQAYRAAYLAYPYSSTLRNLALTSADTQLMGRLRLLRDASTYVHPIWGRIYYATPLGAPSLVQVASTAVVGGYVITVYRDMPYSEYARRQAERAFQLQSLRRMICGF